MILAHQRVTIVTLVQRLSLRWRTFTPVEERVLAAVASALPPTSAELLRAQIACITSVQRILDWTEINFYARKRGRTRWPEASLFPDRREFQLAAATYRIRSTRFRSTLIASMVTSLHSLPDRASRRTASGR
jgi:hypothetical protein